MNPQKSLRIITPYLTMGGAERHLSLILPELAQRGWKIKLLVLSHQIPLKEAFDHPNITLKPLSLPSKFLPSSLSHFFNILNLLSHDFREDSKTLTHFFLPKAYCLGMILGKLWRLKGPLVMSRRSLNFYQKRHKILYFERLLHPFCDAILVNSKAIQNQLNQEERVPQERLHLIYNGLPEKNPSKIPPLETSFSSFSDSFNMVVVANLIPYKGHLDLLKALSFIKKDLGENWTLTLVGQERGHLSVLQKKAHELGLGSHIEWVLTCEDPTPYLLRANLGLLPSHEEGFSNALLEMMKAGLPIIATDVGGNREAILLETGILVPAHNPKALSQGILDLFHHPERRISMGQAAQHRFQNHFTLAQCVSQYEDVYNALLLKNSLT